MIRWFLSRATMRRIGFRFRDRVSGEPVYLYQDRYGKYWLAGRNRFGFRVPSVIQSHPLTQEQEKKNEHKADRGLP